MTKRRRKEEFVLSKNYAKTIAVVELLGQVTSSQILRLVFSEPHTSPASRAWRCNRTLKNLVRQSYLRPIESRATGIGAGWSGWVYLPASSTAAKVDHHELDQAQVYVELKEAEAAGQLKILDLAIREPIGAGHKADDLYVWLEASNGRIDWHVEVDRGTERGPKMRAKLRAYHRAYQAAAGRTFPYVLLVVTFNPLGTISERVKQLRGWIQEQPEPELFHVCTFDELIEKMCS